MSGTLHRFEHDGKRYAIDPETCFCFECDDLSWDVIEYYPETPVNRIAYLLKDKHTAQEVDEVVGELEWLRSTGSILHYPKPDEIQKRFELDRGLQSVTIELAGSVETGQRRGFWSRSRDDTTSSDSLRVGGAAVGLLLARSGTQKNLHVRFFARGQLYAPDTVAALCNQALTTARLAGKELSVSVCIHEVALAKRPKALEGHTVSIAIASDDIEGLAPRIRELAELSEPTLARLAKLLAVDTGTGEGRIIVRPNHPNFGDVVRELDEAGFRVIEIDLDSAYVHNSLEPSQMLEGLSQSADYYAGRLSKHHYFRLDPIASLFWRIYNGPPQPRSDPAGVNELAVDTAGRIYPSWRFFGKSGIETGSVLQGTIDADQLERFEDLGTMTTACCQRCWARNLCGGGTAAVHEALTGDFLQPSEAWCDSQRSWMKAAVSAFNTLSSSGVNFTRVYRQLGGRAKPSLLTIARMALRMQIGIRPIAEADAQWLTEWENWNDSSYFLFNETGIFMATRYDREMDALHPRATETEMVLTQRNGKPIGLMRIRPESWPGVATLWVYLHRPEDYSSPAIRKSFQALLKEAGQQQSMRKLQAPVAAHENNLREFLEATGFEREGTLRESLYLHGAYHDVDIYGVTL